MSAFRLTDAEFETAVTVLRDLIRIDTSNPPGNERAAADYLADVLTREGLTPELAGEIADRPNLACRLPCPNPDPDRRPFVLSCHLDTVPADPERWTHPPFDAVVADGCVWGRGAVDMKGFAAMAVTLMRVLKRRYPALNRDLILVAVADEEAGTRFGSRWLVDRRPDLLGGNPEYVINEVGGFTLHQQGRRFYPVQVAEKGLAWLRLTARGKPGHSSLPAENSALTRLGWAIDRIARARLPWHVSAPARNFLSAIAQESGFLPRLLCPLLLHPAAGPAILPLAVPNLSRRASLEAVLRNTANPTVIRAGNKINVLPGTASVEIDGRLAPGQTAHDLIRELRAALRDPRGERFEIEILRATEATVFPRKTPLFDAIRQTMLERDPDGVVVPSIIPGFTDSANYADLGAICYGFYPLQLPEDLDFAGLFHGDDERIPLAGFRWGIDTLGELLVRFLGTVPASGSSINPKAESGRDGRGIRPTFAATMATITEGNPTRIRLALDRNRYEVVVGEGILDRLPALLDEAGGFGKRAALVTDSTVGPLYAESVGAQLREAGYEIVEIAVPAGEASKSMEQVTDVCRRMLRAGLDRKSFLIALGGGVVGDLAGFAAAIFQRGIPCVQIPTTVVSQVDSSVGGKTGVNTPEGKNLIGAFHQPDLVVADVATLLSLPEREYNEGFAEIVKHAAIRDATLLDEVEKTGTRRENLVSLIARNVAIKAAVVEEDERETKGARALLNFGHTIGHGIENAGGYGRFLHGEAISLGLTAACRLSVEFGSLPQADCDRILSALAIYDLPTRLDADVPKAAILRSLTRDKKFEEGQVRFVLLKELGDAFVSRDVTLTAIEQAIEALYC